MHVCLYCWQNALIFKSLESLSSKLQLPFTLVIGTSFLVTQEVIKLLQQISFFFPWNRCQHFLYKHHKTTPRFFEVNILLLNFFCFFPCIPLVSNGIMLHNLKLLEIGVPNMMWLAWLHCFNFLQTLRQ